MDLLFVFEWLDTSPLAQVSKAYGGVFAVVQMCHLLGLALLGGMVLLADLRLLGLLMTDVPAAVVQQTTQRWFSVGLLIMLLSGVFMSSAVALKLYYNDMYWAKMAALLTGLVFVYGIRRPLLRNAYETLSPWTLRLLAVASLTIWFTVAATGRWIGFS